MPVTPKKPVFDEITDFLATSPSPQAIIDYRLPSDLQQRAHELLDKNRDDTLSEEEHAEMKNFVAMDHIITLLKAKTRIKLKKENKT